MFTEEIIGWASAKGIMANGDPLAQALKTLEETTELLEAVHGHNLEEIADAIGDIYVTIVIQAEMNGLKMEKCVKDVLDVITKRTGRMENGRFIKDA
jgi:NTP pyrophosphatase (non-canonical NTP hydrolase)